MILLITLLERYIIPLLAGVCLESFCYVMYYLFKKDFSKLESSLKLLVISFFGYVSIKLGYGVGVSSSFLEGFYDFIEYSPSFFGYSLYGLGMYMVLHTPLLLYLYIKKKRERYDLIMKRVYILILLFILNSIFVYLIYWI